MTDILLTAGIDLPALERDFARGLQITQSFGASLARAATVNVAVPTVDISAYREAEQVIGNGGLASALREAQAALAALTDDQRAEIAARQLATEQLEREIKTLALFGRTVQGTSAEGVAAWRAEAAAIRDMATQLEVPRETMLRLEVTTQQVERAFTRAQDAAARIKVPAVTASGMGDLVRDSGQFTALGSRVANTAISVAFALEAVATSSKGADGNLRTALRSLAAIGPAFGQPGLIISGVAAATAALLDLAKQSDAAEQSVKAYMKTLADARETANNAATAVRNLTEAQAAQRRLVLTDNLREAREEAVKFRKELLTLSDESLTNSLKNLFSLDGTKSEAFRAQIRDARADFEAGRLSAEGFSTKIAALGNRFPDLAPFARQVLDVANQLTDAERIAKSAGLAIQGVTAATHVPGTPFKSGLEQEIANARQLAEAQRAGGVVAREAFAIAQRQFESYRASSHGAVSETLTFADALKSSDADIRGQAEAFLRDARTIAEFTKSTQGAREALTLAERQLQAFRARAEASVVRLDLAVKLGAGPDTQARLVADLREQYALVAAEVAKQGQPARANLELLRTQVTLADKLASEVKRAADEASQRVTLAPSLGLNTAEQQSAIRALQREYANIVTEINRQGGPQRASVDLLQQQIRLAEQLGSQYARILAAPVPSADSLARPIDPKIEADLRAVRAALDDVTQARTRVRLDELTPPSLRDVEQFSADLATLDAASNLAAVNQQKLADGLKASGLSAAQQQAILTQLEASYREAGTSVDDLTNRIAGLARATVQRITLPSLPALNLPVVPVSIYPRLQEIRLTPYEIERSVGGPLTATVQLRYVNARFVDPDLRAKIDEQLRTVEDALRNASARQTNVEVNVVARTDAESISQARRELAAAQSQARALAEDAARAIAAMGPGPEQDAAWKRYKEIVGDASRPLRDMSAVLRTVATGVNGVLQIADAFGRVDDNVRQALSGVTGLLSGLGDASAALTRIRSHDSGAGVGSLFGDLAGISSIIGIIGGVVSIGAALTQQSAIEREHIAAVQKNSEALSALRADLSDVSKTAAGADAALKFLMSGGPIFNVLKNGGFSGFIGGTHTEINVEFLRQFGLTLDDLTAIAKRFGVDLLDSKGRLIDEALPEFVDAIELSIRKLFRWSDTLDSLSDQRSLANDVFDFTQNDTAQQAAQRALDDASSIFQALTKQAPELFERVFGGIDLETAIGRSTLNLRLNDIITEELSDEFQQGKGWLAELLRKSGFESLADFNKWLLTTDHALDDFTKSTQAATEALGDIPQAFKSFVDLARFDALRPIGGVPLAPRPFDPTPLPAPSSPSFARSPVIVQEHYHFAEGAVVIEGADMQPDEVFEAWYSGARQRARAANGSLAPIERAWSPE